MCICVIVIKKILLNSRPSLSGYYYLSKWKKKNDELQLSSLRRVIKAFTNIWRFPLEIERASGLAQGSGVCSSSKTASFAIIYEKEDFLFLGSDELGPRNWRFFLRNSTLSSRFYLPARSPWTWTLISTWSSHIHYIWSCIETFYLSLDFPPLREQPKEPVAVHTRITNVCVRCDTYLRILRRLAANPKGQTSISTSWQWKRIRIQWMCTSKKTNKKYRKR